MSSATFTHRDSGTPEGEWLDDSRWALLPAATLTARDGWPPDRVVVVAAHPDDESLGAAGVLHQAHAAGIPCHLLVATDGERSHPEGFAGGVPALARARRAESSEALSQVAPSAEATWLGLEDSGLADSETALADAVESMVGPRSLVLAPWRGDGHADHEAAGRAAATAAARTGARLLEYPIWLWHWGTPADLPFNQALRLDLDAHAVRLKAEAISRHRTQTTPAPGSPDAAPMLSPAFLEHFSRAFEVLIETGIVTGARTQPFDAMFDEDDDPWQVDSSWYERRKRAVTLACLPIERLGRVLEVGCSIGALTADLADRADTVIGVDVSAEALARAGRRLADRPAVRLRLGRVPGDWPAGEFDTISLSEVGYFLTREELAEVARLSVAALAPGGCVVVCNWRHPIEDWPLQGDEVHVEVRSASGLLPVGVYEDADFRVEVLRTAGAPSVAETDGVL